MINRIIFAITLMGFLYLATDKFQRREGLFQSSMERPLGTLMALDNYLLANDYIRESEELDKIIPKFGIPTRVITYKNPTIPKKGDAHDTILVLVDFYGAVRAVGSYFVPKVAIPPYHGKTEKIMKTLWTLVDKENPDPKMDDIHPDQFEDPAGQWEVTAESSSLNAVWIRKQNMDSIFILTKMSSKELELKRKSEETLPAAPPVADQPPPGSTVGMVATPETDTSDVHIYKALITERKIMAGKYSDLKKQWSRTADPAAKKSIETELRNLKEEGRILLEKIASMESELPPETVEKFKEEKNRTSQKF